MGHLGHGLIDLEVDGRAQQIVTFPESLPLLGSFPFGGSVGEQGHQQRLFRVALLPGGDLGSEGTDSWSVGRSPVGFNPQTSASADAAQQWDRRARTVEAWRYHHLGLGYNQPAAGPDAPPSEQGLGRSPSDPVASLGRRRVLERCQSTLDLGASQ
jgi:hypothetical protein